MFTSIVAAIFGLAIGSFLNVCIYRLPEKKSIVFPGSHCPNCNTFIKWYDNIPVLSFIVLGAKCRHCKKKISYRYPSVELITALLTALFVYKFGITIWLTVSLVAVYALIVLSFIDLQTFTIPDELSLGILVLGFLTSFLNPNFSGEVLYKFAQSLIGILCGFGLIYLTAVIGEFLFKKEAMGGGDIKLLAGVGAFVGWQGVISTLIIGSLAGTLYGVYLLVTKKIKKRDPIPFGPFLSIGAIVNLYQVVSFWDILNKF
ncbi:MAG TPA: prepilin peptidase [Elusimicrobiales bacterium]|nr:prepilin peptidase [Elusimicrobiales bacterium]